MNVLESGINRYVFLYQWSADCRGFQLFLSIPSSARTIKDYALVRSAVGIGNTSRQQCAQLTCTLSFTSTAGHRHWRQYRRHRYSVIRFSVRCRRKNSRTETRQSDFGILLSSSSTFIRHHHRCPGAVGFLAAVGVHAVASFMLVLAFMLMLIFMPFPVFLLFSFHWSILSCRWQNDGKIFSSSLSSILSLCPFSSSSSFRHQPQSDIVNHITFRHCPAMFTSHNWRQQR